MTLTLLPQGTLAAPPATLPVSIQKAPALDPNFTPYPRSSLHNFADLLDAPAGKYGFLKARGEHFVWSNGKRARFWGINVANTSLQEPDVDIAAIIENFRTAGFNLLRLHHFDERGGIIDVNATDSRQFIPERLRKLDYWIYKAKQAGIYVYLDLLDYRRFKPGDGVPNAEAIGRAGRPYNVFDARLLELQKEYARKLLKEHVNPYTGLAYVDDPAIVMVEIHDESGLFMRRTVWRAMPEPYNTNFRRLWNAWLRQRYGNTGRLTDAWTGPNGVSALKPYEDLEKNNVELPSMSWDPQLLPVAQRQWAALPRRNDGARFAYELHRKFFREMRDYLLGIGVKVPMTATGRFEDLADLKAVSEELDFIGTNFYYDHPYWPGQKPAWQPPSFFHNHNPLSDIDDHSMAAAVSLSRITGKPFVVREWNYCWPNRNRAAGIIEAACYAALHDIDAMILFVYETRPTARVSYFNVRSDPSRWGLCGVGAQIFLQGLVQPSRHKIVVPYGPIDTFTYTRYHQPFYALAWATRLENDFFDSDVYYASRTSPPALLVNPGRSGVGRYEGAPAVLHTEDLRCDLAGRTIIGPDYLQDYRLAPRPVGSVSLRYDGILFDPGALRGRNLGMG
ncbi:MAG: beta-galactosidase, partial [Armatimonadota bacterium]|nr:beta-galactosidase [Armatimonadota bacterium]